MLNLTGLGEVGSGNEGRGQGAPLVAAFKGPLGGSGHTGRSDHQRGSPVSSTALSSEALRSDELCEVDPKAV